jgi:uncharacterized LabA/DUF88 family protein
LADNSQSQEEQRIALFIDFENIAIGVRDAHYRKFDINLVLERLVEKGKILSKRAYADWGRYSEYRRSFHEAAIELIEVPQKSVGGKNSADIRLVVDAMDMSFQKEHIDCFCIASGDSDFSPLVSKLKENDKYVIGLGVKNSTSELLIDNCDEFIFYEDLVRRQEAPAVVVATPGLSAKQQEAFQILVDSVIALQRENKESLWGSMVKETMKRKKPSFNESYYGFRSFSHLLEDAQKRGIVTLRRDQKSGSYVVADLGPASQFAAPGTSAAANGHAAAATVPVAPSSSTADGVPGAHAAPIAAVGHVTAVTPLSPVPDAAEGAAGGPASAGLSEASDGLPSLAAGAEPRTDKKPRRRRGGRGRSRGRDRDAGTSGSSPVATASDGSHGRAGDSHRDEASDLDGPDHEDGVYDDDSSEDIGAPLAVAPTLNVAIVGPVSVAAASSLPAAPLSSQPAAPTGEAARPTPADRWIARAPETASADAPLSPEKASFSLIGWLKGGQ